MAIQDRSVQYRKAMDRANEVKSARAELRREVALGQLAVVELLEVEVVGSMTLANLLAWQHRWSGVRTRKFLGRMGISEFVRVRDLTERQRGLVRRCVNLPPSAW